LLHQGTLLVPADFLAFAEPNHDLVDMHDLLLANFLAPAPRVGVRPHGGGGGG
jgi:glucose-6-phosphate isomerase